MEKEPAIQNNPESDADSLENKEQESLERELSDPLIKEQLKRITIFGSFSEPNEEESEKLKRLGKSLAEQNLTILVGGNYGYLKEAATGAVENDGRVIVVGTTAGKEKGWATENIRGRLRGVYYEGGYPAKKQGLFHESVGAYVVLPSQTLGTYTELVEAVDKMASFDTYLDRFPQPVIFVGDFWKEKFEQEIKPRIKERVLEHIYFVENEKGVIDVLSKYAKLKREYEQK